jgi:acetylxylan esterase
MYIYVPDQVATKPPIVVGPHSCQGNGPGTYSQQSSLVSIANKNGFIMIFPEATGQNCWDAGSDRSLNHGGKGDAPAIVQMVKYTLSKYNGDAGRVYSVGQSSGGIMTEALLGVFPDVFMAGVSIMGVPCGCWADGYQDNIGKPASGTGQWSGPCAGGTNTKTGKEWGDLVRSYFPGYTGHRPRLEHWHGTADTTINYKNMAEDIKEWTNLLGLSESPSGSDTPNSGTTRQFWKNACGYTVYETFSLAGVGHAVGFDGNAVAAYFGLDKAGGQDPETVACPGGGTGGGGGASGSGGGIGAGGGGGGGGSGGRDAGGSGSGDAQAGGSSGGGGTRPEGGASGSGGAVGSGGNGGGMGSGGGVGGGGSSARGGSSGDGSGGTQGTGGATGGRSGGGGSTENAGSATASGCSCAVGKDATRSVSQVLLLLVACGLVLRRQRRASH